MAPLPQLRCRGLRYLLLLERRERELDEPPLRELLLVERELLPPEREPLLRDDDEPLRDALLREPPERELDDPPEREELLRDDVDLPRDEADLLRDEAGLLRELEELVRDELRDDEPPERLRELEELERRRDDAELLRRSFAGISSCATAFTSCGISFSRNLNIFSSSRRIVFASFAVSLSPVAEASASIAV